jgi:ribosomal protein S18 acetylase RimI-like enzyme
MDDFLDTHYTADAIVEELRNPQCIYFVAHVDEETVGFSALRFDSDEQCLQSYDNRIELQRLYVKREYHGLGIAQLLCDTMMGEAERRGYAHIWLGVWEHNARARRYYDKLGLRQVGEHMFRVGQDEQRDLTVLRRITMQSGADLVDN